MFHQILRKAPVAPGNEPRLSRGFPHSYKSVNLEMHFRSYLLSGVLLAGEIAGYMSTDGEHLGLFTPHNDFTPVIFEGMDDPKLVARQQCSGGI